MTDRLESLDAFRGITVAAMLVVNNPGTWSAIYPPLRHATWHGWTPTDLIFPFFLFIVGVAMSLSFAKLRARGVGRRALLAKAAKRAAILVLLGLVLHAFPWVGTDLSELRLPGVLQRIGIAYLIATPIVLFAGWRGRLAALGALLLGYWALLELVPVPGIGAGVLEPGRDLGAWLDRTILGTDHLWDQSRTWDPEGLLSTLPAVGSVLLGVFVGDWLRGPRAPRTTATGLIAAGGVAVALGLAWGVVLPINKPLWTSSYAVFTAGMATLVLAGCWLLIDVKGHRGWARPFVVFGINALAAFFLASLAARMLGMAPAPGGAEGSLKSWIYSTIFGSWLPPMDASLAFALVYVALWMAAMWGLYRKGIVLKV
ncbi:MAG TPA: heparan-alpha-glucosaminide N-acetyltransferase domain-containing protein [Longimicrobiales bacterium]|nr:heparan-alpha-glucosaminide N-acetyltransferase domain-containing protein [Longimicrobiales bacterium]